jgi:hypothetical protein
MLAAETTCFILPPSKSFGRDGKARHTDGEMAANGAKRTHRFKVARRWRANLLSARFYEDDQEDHNPLGLRLGSVRHFKQYVGMAGLARSAPAREILAAQLFDPRHPVSASRQQVVKPGNRFRRG